MRKRLVFGLLAAVITLPIADLAEAQMGGGGMGSGGGGGGHGGGRGGGRGGHRDGQGGQTAPAGTPTPGIQAPASVPATMRLTGVVTVAGQAKSLSKMAIIAAKPDQSAIYAERGAQVILDGVQLSSAVPVSVIEDGRETGLASALLIAGQSSVTMTGGQVATNAAGVNAIYVNEAGSHAVLKGVSVSTRASNAYAIQLSGGAELNGDGLKVATESDHAPAVAVQDAMSHAVLTGGDFTTDGPLSPGIYAAGDLSATDASITANHAEAIVLDGARRVELTNTRLSGDGSGIVIYAMDKAPSAARGPNSGFGGGFGGHGPRGGPQGAPGGRPEGPPDSGSGRMTPVSSAVSYLPDAGAAPPTRLAMTGGAIKTRGDAFAISNLTADIRLDHVDIHPASGVIVRSVAKPFGPLGRNGGNARIEAHNQALAGDFVTDVISNIRLDLRDGSQLTGKTTSNVDVTLDASSHWSLTDDTRVGKLMGAVITEDTVSNITGNGHSLSYDSRYNPDLGGKTYQLAGGGSLAPGNGL